MRKFGKLTFMTIFSGFALIGFLLTSLFIASLFHLTDTSGEKDSSSYILNSIAQKLHMGNKAVLDDSTNIQTTSLDTSLTKKITLLCKLHVLEQYAPSNAAVVYKAYTTTNSDALLTNMISAAEFHLLTNKDYVSESKKCMSDISANQAENSLSSPNLFTWSDDSDTWNVLTKAILKDRGDIQKAASASGIEARMLATPLFVEQWRAYTSERELFKNLLKPLQALATSTNFSLGTMNIKEDVAIQIENNLKNSHSPYYLGPKFEHLLDFKTANTHAERFQRLANYTHHYYSYLYAGLYLAEIEKQWQNAGYDIHDRPEIVATLFNIGFKNSHPKPNPSVGGAVIRVNGIPYTFGKLAYDFYYSGQLMDAFPYELFTKQ